MEEIRAKLLEFYQKHQHESQLINTRLAPWAEKMLSHEAEESRRVHVRVAGLEEFQIQSTEFIDVVDLDQRCTCRKWELLGIPCSHTLAAMQMRKLNLYDFCEH